MARIFIDLTDDERHWNGEIAIEMRSPDSLGGKDAALAIGDHEIVLSISQAITLFDVLDGWLNGGPVRAIGAIERRVMEAIKETVADHGDLVRAATIKKEPEALARAIYHNMKFKGLRFRLTDDQERAA